MNRGSIMTQKENEASNSESEGSGSMVLNGEAWKDRNQTTYTSLLDQYGVSDLFSYDSIRLYQKLEQEKHIRQQEVTKYVFSGRMQVKEEEDDMVERIFSEEIQLSRVRDYNKNEDDYSICFVLAEILFVLAFIYILIKINSGRRKKEETHAAEINLEN